jgi:putative glutamine amidotransferase
MPLMSPRIGITTSYEDGTQRLDRRYVAAVERAGGLPLLLPMLESDAAHEEIVDLLDGLVVIGGPAVTEGLVGTLPEALGALGSRRADSDRRWIERCWDAGGPILGICYGMQRLSALAGGTIYGDVEHQHDGARTHSQKRGGTTHPVQIVPNSRLHALLGRDTLTVNTRHLQAIETPGGGFSVAATAPDGVIEAIEHESGRVFGVQFHPERMGEEMAPLFRWLVETAVEAATVDSA